MATLVPVWSDNVSVIAAQVLARNANPLVGSLDLRTKKWGYLYPKFGRGGTTALTNGVRLLVLPELNNGGASVGANHPQQFDYISSTVAAVSPTVNANAAAGDVTLGITSQTGIVAGEPICIQDAGGGVTRLEWNVVSRLISTTGIALVLPLSFAHTSAQADTVRSKADIFPRIPVTGGTLWKVVIDYGDDAAGDSITVQVLAQTYDYDEIVP